MAFNWFCISNTSLDPSPYITIASDKFSTKLVCCCMYRVDLSLISINLNSLLAESSNKSIHSSSVPPYISFSPTSVSSLYDLIAVMIEFILAKYNLPVFSTSL